MSAQAQYTPGPYAVNGRVCEVGEDKHLQWCGWIEPKLKDPYTYRGQIAHVQSATHVEDGITCEEAEATAYLLAASPDLLEALRAAHGYCLNDPDYKGSATEHRVLAAFAKARLQA